MFRWTLFVVATFASTGCFNSLLLTPTNSSGPVEETVITDPEHWYCRDKVAIIDVEGLIMNARSSGMFGSGDNPLSLFRERLDAAADDKHVKAVVLRINSPGGAVTASDIMYQEVLSFRRDTHKPVVACMMDVAASGAYYLAMGCDKVYAHPTTVTGSIGVIMSLYNASGLFAKIGVSSDPIKSGPNKDIGNPGRPMTPEEHAILQGLVDSFYGQFVHVVAEGRRMPEDHVRTLADGRVYSGTDAQKLGLVDVVGYLPDAIQAAMDMACIKDAEIVAYDRCEGYRGSIYAAMPKIPSQINVKLDLPGLSNPSGAAFMYVWEPGVAH
ncbi:MAG TPA: signal peptide peptidase SppA [Gemmataceae bacterium]|nr:signal peptide peptidase SppA [Gemmataceae bacterium]